MSELKDIITPRYTCVDSNEKWRQFIDDVKQMRPSLVGYDSETTGLHYKCDLVGCSVALAPGVAYYFPFIHRLGKNVPSIRPTLYQLLSKMPSVAHNAGFDWMVAQWAGHDVNIVHDTMVQVYLMDPNDRSGLKHAASRYLGVTMTEYEELFPTKKASQSMTFAELSPEDETIINYACADADMSLRLHLLLYPRIEKGFNTLYKVENALWKVITKMEMRGIMLDCSQLEQQAVLLEKEVDRWRDEVWKLAGRQFELNSTAQVGKVLFEELGIPSGKRTKTGKASTDASVLQELAESYPIAHALLKYKELFKLLGSFVKRLPDYVAEDGAIHCSFLQCHVPTGRFACANPNLQQVPKNDPAHIRRAFVARPGYYFADFDYSTVEYRILVSKAKEQRMIEAFDRGEDFHALNAMNIFGLRTVEQVTREQRDVGKTINFGVLYGMESWSLAKRLQIPKEKAEEVICSYFQGMPQVKAWIDAVHSDTLVKGYVKTHFGRRRNLPEVFSPDRKIKAFGLRSSVNTIVQGCLADTTWIATSHRLVQIGELFQTGLMEGERIWNGTDYCEFKVHEAEPKPVWEVAFTSGAKVQTSSNHPFLVYGEHGEKWTEAKDLEPGALVFRNNQRPRPLHMPSREELDYCEVVGVLCAGGWLSPTRINVVFNDDSQDVKDWFFQTLNGLGYEPQIRRVDREKHGRKSSDMVVLPSGEAQRFIASTGLKSVEERDREIPRYVLEKGVLAWGAFLCAFHSHGGWNLPGEQRMKVQSETLARQVFELYGILGYRPRLSTMENGSWIIEVRERLRLNQELGWYGEHNQCEQTEGGGQPFPRPLARRIGAALHSNRDFYPALSADKMSHVLRIKAGSASLYSARSFLKEAGMLEEFPEVAYAWDEVVTVRELGVTVPMKDIEILDGPPFYLISGLVVHNTAADVMKIALVRLDKAMEPFGAHLLLTVHDQVVIEVPETVPEVEIEAAIRQAMELKIEGWCSLPVDGKFGYNWEDKARSLEEARGGSFAKKEKDPRAVAPSRITVDMSKYEHPGIHVKVDVITEESAKSLRQVLSSFPNPEGYHFYLHLEGQAIHSQVRIGFSQEFIAYLKRVLGDQCVIELYDADGVREPIEGLN